MSRPPERIWPAASVILPIALAAAVQLYAFHWGVITPDTVFQWEQALTGRYDEWHPPVTAWMWRQLMPLGRGTTPVLVFDVALYWLGIGLIADVLRRRGRRVVTVAVLCIGIAPIPFGQMGAILKDPLLAACCLLASALLLLRRRPGFGGATLLALPILLFATATRINALFATVPLLVALLPPAWTAGKARLAVASLAAALVLATGSWLIDSVALHPHRSQPIYSLVNFDLAGIVAHGGAHAYPGVPPSAAARATARCYRARQFNPQYAPDCDTVEERLRVRAAAAGDAPLTIWRRAVAAAPIAYLLHRAAHANENWRFLVACVPQDAVYVMTTPNEFGLAFAPNRATRLISAAAQGMAWSPLGRPATWLAVALGLLLVAPCLPSGRVVTALAASALGYGGAYAVVSVAPDLRYNLWTMLAAAVALAIAASEMRGRGIPAQRLQLAAVPLGLTVVAELIALAAPCAG